MGKLRASAGEVDLNPPIGGWMTGFAARVLPTTGVHDPIMARAVLIDDGGTRLAIVSCDLLGFASAAVAEMRSRIAAKTSIPAGNILICCTHTHSGPSSMPLRGWLAVVDEQWLEEAKTRIVELVSSLPDRLEPALFAYGSTSVPGIGYNRQDPARHTDEELIAISFERKDGSAIATMINYATHAVVLGPKNLEYSGDFPGATARQLGAARGGVGMYLQGACGDVDPEVYRCKGWGQGAFEDCEEIGAKLADGAIDALANAPRTTDVALATTSRIVNVPLDPPPTIEGLNRLLAQFQADQEAALVEPGDRVAELVAVAMQQWANELKAKIETDAVPATIPAELFTAAINDLRLVTLPFETYTDIGLGTKSGVKPLKGVFIGYSNGLLGYCPTAWAKDQGGYGADASCRWFPELVTAIGYGAAELLTEEGSRLGKSI